MRSVAVLAAAAAICSGLLGGLLCGCPTTPTPTTQPPAVIYGELVDAGCLQATDSGLEAIQQAIATPGAPAWFSCLANGGTVASCHVPCNAAQ